MDAGSSVFDIEMSRDGTLIVTGTKSGLVTVWNAESHSKVTEFKSHDRGVLAVDVSPDATKIATGSADHTACVWSLTGEQLLCPLEHDYYVVTVKFSPDERLIATVTCSRRSVRVYDSQNGVSSSSSQSRSTWCSTGPSSGSVIGSNYSPYHTTATSTMSTCPPVPRARHGAFTVATVLHASPWQTTADLSLPPLVPR